MASKSSTKKSGSSTRRKRPNWNQVRAKIRELALEYRYDEQVLRQFAEFVNGGAFPIVEPSMKELKDAVFAEFKCTSYKELKKNDAFQLYVEEHNLKMNRKASWLQVYRKFVGLPDSERNAVSNTSINGIDVLRNFLPWQVFALDPKTTTVDDIKSAFNQLAKEHHPDHGGNPEVFQKLKTMRDSLLAAY